MSFSSAVRTTRLSAWICIFCLILTVGVADCQFVQLQTTSPKAAQCGENVTLTCEVNLTQESDIRLFSWQAKNATLCMYGYDQSDHISQCEATKAEPSAHALSLTLFNVMPINAGKYTCRIRSTQGITFKSSTITVQECPGNSSRFMNKSHATCSFNGVFPSGVVHWFQGDANLTDSSRTEQEVDRNGLYNILSSVQIHNGRVPYNCSLWMPALTKYHTWRLLEVKASASVVTLRWVCVVMEVITVKIIL